MKKYNPLQTQLTHLLQARIGLRITIRKPWSFRKSANQVRLRPLKKCLSVLPALGLELRKFLPKPGPAPVQNRTKSGGPNIKSGQYLSAPYKARLPMIQRIQTPDKSKHIFKATLDALKVTLIHLPSTIPT